MSILHSLLRACQRATITFSSQGKAVVAIRDVAQRKTMPYPCAVKQHGFYEGVGHATNPIGAQTVLRQSCQKYAEVEVEVSRKLIRLDGEMVEAFVAEPL